MQSRHVSTLFLFPLVLGTGAVALASAGEGDKGAWPQWRGPERDGLSRETAWVSEGKGESLWEMEVGLGYSSVSVQDGRVYTMGFDEEAQLDLVWCLDAETGEELWVHTFPAKIWNQAHRGGTVNTPSLDGDVVYVLNREGNMYCLDAASGEPKWHRQLKEEHDLTYPTWGFSASPLVLPDELIVNCGKVLSLDKETGDVRWASEDYGHAYSTPAAFELDGTPALAVFNGGGVAVLERKRGKEMYFLEDQGGQRGVNAATPIVIEDAVFISSGRRGGGALLAFGDEGLEPVWENRSMANSMSGCVLMDDHLYGFDGAVLKCIGVDGSAKWEERGIGNGALMGTPGRLITMSSRGELIVAEASPERYQELSRVKLFEEGVFWTKPVLVDGLIYARSNEGQLVCRDHRAPN